MFVALSKNKKGHPLFVKMEVIDNMKKETVEAFVTEHIAEKSTLQSDGHRTFPTLTDNYNIVNDCKYGYDIKDSTIRLSLLRAPRWPDVTADQGEHEFTYSLYPHEQDWRSAHVARSAMELNHPVRVKESQAGAAAEADQQIQANLLPSRLELMPFESRHVILDTIKAAERGEGSILRLYESAGGREQVTLLLPQAAREAVVVNLLEEELYKLDIQDGCVQLSFKPFEILSIRLR
ncbi:glycosyl hydrolase-related protein [Paenibacillus sp. LHD-38]|uniref:glycosyl hydrolase-related protein n=1 Tax=Paenibacillus sp. LHD-38 TaxID=3072143 RepID=UPI00280DA217|nr:glycosyl hydrolase-related protein [Paenibacillus sp. LHD-38]MDQ8738778.1 glycosyl hydrolase-related protein [Paenibacillus sp. LHD-38]